MRFVEFAGTTKLPAGELEAKIDKNDNYINAELMGELQNALMDLKRAVSSLDWMLRIIKHEQAK